MNRVTAVLIILSILALALGLWLEARDGRPWALRAEAQVTGFTLTPSAVTPSARNTPTPSTPIPTPTLGYRKNLPLCEKDVNRWGWYYERGN